MSDLSAERPGEMGWLGSEWDQRLYDQFASESPETYSRRPVREPVSVHALAEIENLQKEDGIDGGCSLQHIEKYVFGDFLDWKAQIIGSCVASGGMRVIAHRTMWESFVLGDPEEIFGTKLVGTDNVASFAPYNYRAGRKIGGLNGGDGSFCSAHIQGCQRYGILPCSTPGIQSDAFPEPQSSSTYRRYGNSNSFLDEFSEPARKFKLLETEKVRSASDAKTLICEHYKPMMICSMWAFKPSGTHPSWKLEDGSPVVIYQRDRGTSWAHNMSVVACVEVSGNWYIIIKNSWGQRAHRNGDWFAIPIELFDSWLRDAECMTIGDIELVDNVLPGD